jgi:hypothetical protein
MGGPVGNKEESWLARMTELPQGSMEVAGLHGGIDVFGDGSFIVVEAPGVSSHRI